MCAAHIVYVRLLINDAVIDFAAQHYNPIYAPHTLYQTNVYIYIQRIEIVRIIGRGFGWGWRVRPNVRPRKQA